MGLTQLITPNLWFDTQAEDAVNFYVSVFKDAKIGRITYYGKEGFETHGQPEGRVLTIEFFIDGQQYVALNGGPLFKFNESVSLVVNCETQQEVDYYWEKLTAGDHRNEQMCGWLKDPFGLSWQVVPVKLQEMIADPDQVKAGRLMNALLKMKKLDLAMLEAAYDAA